MSIKEALKKHSFLTFLLVVSVLVVSLALKVSLSSVFNKFSFSALQTTTKTTKNENKILRSKQRLILACGRVVRNLASESFHGTDMFTYHSYRYKKLAGNADTLCRKLREGKHPAKVIAQTVTRRELFLISQFCCNHNMAKKEWFQLNQLRFRIYTCSYVNTRKFGHVWSVLIMFLNFENSLI